jgi:hypothetical protein
VINLRAWLRRRARPHACGARTVAAG